MSSFLGSIGTHYEVWRTNENALCVNVVHTNRAAIRCQQAMTPQEWWDYYRKQADSNTIVAVRHAKQLVTTYEREFREGAVAFRFKSAGDPPCQVAPPSKSPTSSSPAKDMTKGQQRTRDRQAGKAGVGVERSLW